MTQDVQQWLTEIRSLQNQVADLRQDRDEAYRSAANWRSLYETEAKQRRAEVADLKQAIEQMRQEQDAILSNAGNQGIEPMTLGAGGESQQGALAQSLSNIDLTHLSDHELRSLLLKALTDFSQLQQELHRERAAHIQTQQSLMSALEDTVDLLRKERAQQNHGQRSEV